MKIKTLINICLLINVPAIAISQTGVEISSGGGGGVLPVEVAGALLRDNGFNDDQGSVGASIILTLKNTGVLFYGFDDGTLEGWSLISGGSSPELGWAPTAFEDPFDFPPATSGSFKLMPDPFENRDLAHDTLLLRSPVFTLSGGDIYVDMIGGEGNGTSQGTLPASVSELASSSVNADGVHAMGFGVRRVSDDTYVATAQLSVFGATAFTTVSIPSIELALFADGTTAYTLDVFDSYNGSWSWIGIDSVTIPGAESSIFAEGFESGNTDAWSAAVGN